MTAFLFIPYKEIAEHDSAVFEQLLKLEGCGGFTLEREGIIIEPNSRAHVRACLLNIGLLSGEWLEPEDV